MKTERVTRNEIRLLRSSRDQMYHLLRTLTRKEYVRITARIRAIEHRWAKQTMENRRKRRAAERILKVKKK